MAYYRRSTCKRCNAHGDHVHISKAGYCPDCSIARAREAQEAMRNKEGPDYDRWRFGLLMAAGTIGRPTTPYPPDA